MTTDAFTSFEMDNAGTVGAELTWAHIFKALEIGEDEFSPHPLHVKAMADMLGPQVACADCWELRDDCGKHT